MRLYTVARGDFGARQLATDANHGCGRSLCQDHGRPARSARRGGGRRRRQTWRPMALAALGADPQRRLGAPRFLPGIGCQARRTRRQALGRTAHVHQRRPRRGHQRSAGYRVGDRPADQHPSLGDRPLGKRAKDSGSGRCRSGRDGLPAGLQLRGRSTWGADGVNPRPGVQGIPPSRTVGPDRLGIR
ncbi:hypothetical protein D3C81_1498570 [compost metagenome]